MQKYEVNKQNFRSLDWMSDPILDQMLDRIGSLGNIIFDILKPPAV